MTGNDAAGLVHQDCGGEAPLTDAGCNLGDLLLAVGARVLGVWHQLFDRPLLYLVGWIYFV
jgi:hypothetical protein